MMKRVLMLATLCAFQAQAAYPERPITLIVPFAAGGPTDVVARIVATTCRGPRPADRGRKRDRRGGTTGDLARAQATPDGYKIMMGHMVHAWGGARGLSESQV